MRRIYDLIYIQEILFLLRILFLFTLHEMGYLHSCYGPVSVTSSDEVEVEKEVVIFHWGCYFSRVAGTLAGWLPGWECYTITPRIYTPECQRGCQVEGGHHMRAVCFF